MSLNLPTLAEVEALRRGKPISKLGLKGKSRLDDVVDERKLTKVTDKDFKKEVWTRDKHRCRCCGRKVLKTISRVPERGEVHHCSGRRGDLRFLSRGALLLCLADHERCTGKVNDKLTIIPSKTFEFKGQQLIDARFPVTFKEMR